MNFTIFLFVSLFWSLILAQGGVNNSETEKNSEISLCFPDMCDLLKEFGAMKEKLEAMETRLKESETRLNDSENQILELKNKERTMVVFSAATGPGGAKGEGGIIGPFNTDTTLVYKTVKTNIGNAYSQFTGIFTAPVTGIYYFTFFCHAHSTHTICLKLIKNNEVIVNTYDHKTSNDGADNGGNAVFLQLQQGDEVYMRMCANSNVYGNSYITTFSGFLVGDV